MNLLYGVTKRQKCRNYRTGTCSKYQIKLLAQVAAYKALDLTEDSKAIESLGTPAVEAQNSTRPFWREFCHL